MDEYFTEQTEFNVTLFGKSADGSVEVPTNVITVFLQESNNLWQKDAPEPQNSWFVQVVDARDETLTAAIRAENAAIHQPYINSETETWWVWDISAGAYRDTGKSSRGDPGPAGVGVPDGGTEGQFLGKTADGPAWVDIPERGGGLPTGGAPYQQLVTDGEGNAKWENRLCYATERVKVDMPGSGTISFYKVSDAIPTGDLSAGAVATIWTSIGAKKTVNIFNPVEGVYLADTAIVILNDNIEADGVVFPEKGTYFWAQNEFNYTSGFALGEVNTPKITWDGNPEIIKKLDEKYLPNHTVVFTKAANGHVTCNISYDDLYYLVDFGVPIVANFVSTGNYCATIQAFTLNDSNIGFLFTTIDVNTVRTYKYMYNSDGTIVEQVE